MRVSTKRQCDRALVSPRWARRWAPRRAAAPAPGPKNLTRVQEVFHSDFQSEYILRAQKQFLGARIARREQHTRVGFQRRDLQQRPRLLEDSHLLAAEPPGAAIGVADLDAGFGHMVVSEIEVPNMLANIV